MLRQPPLSTTAKGRRIVAMSTAPAARGTRPQPGRGTWARPWIRAPALSWPIEPRLSFRGRARLVAVEARMGIAIAG